MRMTKFDLAEGWSLVDSEGLECSNRSVIRGYRAPSLWDRPSTRAPAISSRLPKSLGTVMIHNVHSGTSYHIYIEGTVTVKNR